MTTNISNQKNLRLNLGCGKFPKNGFVNCDIQDIKGVDIVMDCADLSRFKTNSVSLIFCHSFFEHLYMYQLVPFLKECKRVLNDNGMYVILGIPDFEKISWAYITKPIAQPIFKKPFNLYQAYRLTHGDYEGDGKASIPQMHKSIYDKKLIAELFNKSGYKNTRVFNYKFPGETEELALGVIATKSAKLTYSKAKKCLSEFKKYISNIDQVDITLPYSVCMY